MNRRTLLSALVSVLAATRSPRAAAEAATHEALADLLRVLPGISVAVRLGRRYLAEAGTRGQLDALRADVGLGGRTRWAADARSAARERRHADFVAGEVVTVDGWILARCEAAACGLLVLAIGNGP